MNKIIYLIMICNISLVFATNIINIDNITNEETKLRYNIYDGSVYSYDNRLIVLGQNAIVEYEILEDGNYNLVGFFERRASFFELY